MAPNGRKTLTMEDKRLRDRLIREVGPSAQESAGGWVRWEDMQSVLGQPFDMTQIPLSKLYQMRRDPMIAFALLFVKVPLVRSQWYIEGEEPDICAFVDNALRRIYGRFIFQYTNCLDFGYSPLIKKFETIQPDWVYQDPDDPTKEKQVWSNGNVEALVWKPFQALAPDNATPWWLEDGSFGGIIYKAQTVPSFAQNNSPKKKPDIPVELSLWATNDKDSVFGSLWGYPRIAHAYRYWWSYWYRWALADRHFERDADPPCYVYFPPADFDDDGEIVSNQAQALRIGEQIRSGSTVALPSGVVTDNLDKATNQRQWEIGFLEGGGNFDAFDKTFAYLDIAKLRAIMIPEQAFLEGRGGTSSRNVAEQLGDVFYESQAILQDEIDDHLNRYVIPQLVQANFGQGHVVRKRTRGFASQDTATAMSIIQLFGQADPTSLEVDMREILRQQGIPLLTPKQLALEEKKAADLAKQQAPPQTPSKNGYAGVNQWGFYHRPREVLELADWTPDTPHFDDPEVADEAENFRDEWRKLYAETYEDFANYLSNVDLAEMFDERQMLHMGPSVAVIEKILDKWIDTSEEIRAKFDRVSGFVRSIMDVAGRRELARIRVRDVDWSMDNPGVVEFARKHAADLVRNVTNTTRNELRRFLVREFQSSDDPKMIAAKVRDHFSQWPSWKADRLARTESMMAYNVATLMAYKEAGVEKVKAHDAAIKERSDPECIARDGKVFTIAEAFKEQAKEHPNGTLSWSAVPSASLTRRIQQVVNETGLPMPPGMEPLPIAASEVSFEVDPDLRVEGEPVLATFDEDELIVTFSQDADEFDIDMFLMSLSEEHVNLGPWATLKRAWDESKVKRGFHGRFSNQFKAKPSPSPEEAAKAATAAKRAKYDVAEKKLRKGVEKQVAKAHKDSSKSHSKQEPVSSYLIEDPSHGITKGKLNQKRLLAFANAAVPKKHPPGDGKKTVLDAPTTTVKYAMRASDGTLVWSPERKKIHDHIIDMFLRRRDEDDPKKLSDKNEYLPSQQHPQVFFTGGGYTAGKGFLLDGPLMRDQVPKDGITLDPDIIKSFLPEYDKLVEIDPSMNMALYEEAWEIAQAVQAEAMKRRINVVVDGISDTSADEFLARAKAFSDAGYTYDDPNVGRRANGTSFNGRVVYVDAPTDEAVKRGYLRARNSPRKADRRYIPEVIQRAVHRDVAATFPEVAARAKESGVRVELWDNYSEQDKEKGDPYTNYSVPVRVAYTDQNGDLIIERPEVYQKFLAKANEDITPRGERDPKTGEPLKPPKFKTGRAPAQANIPGETARSTQEKYAEEPDPVVKLEDKVRKFFGKRIPIRYKTEHVREVHDPIVSHFVGFPGRVRREGVVGELLDPLAGVSTVGRGRTITREKKAKFLAGGTASGKSTVFGGVTDEVDVNSDKVKEMLDEYQRVKATGNPDAAAWVHEESSWIAGRIRREAMAAGLKMVVDGTGDAGPGKFVRKLKEAHDAGYDVDVTYVDVPTDIAVERAKERAKKDGRHVREDVIRATHENVAARWEEVIALDFANVTLYSTNVPKGAAPVLIATKKTGGKLVIHDQKEYDRWLLKAQGVG